MKEYSDFPPCNNPKVPAPSAPLRYCTEVQTRFVDFDIFGHLNNTVYMALLDMGKVGYYRDVLHHDFDFRQTTAVIVNINLSFASPAYMGEPLAVFTACIHVSRHSFTLEQRIINTLTGDVKCYARTVMACFDARTATGAEVPQEWIKSAADFEKWPETPNFAEETPSQQK